MKQQINEIKRMQQLAGILKESEFYHRGEEKTQFLTIPDNLEDIDADDFYNAVEFLGDGEMDERNFEPNKEYTISVNGEDVSFKFKPSAKGLEVDTDSIKK